MVKRCAVGLFDQVSGQGLEPVGIYFGGVKSVLFGGLHQRAYHYPFGRFFTEAGTGEDKKLAVSGTQKLPFVFANTYLTQEAR